MPARILVIDPVAINRILLKVKLSVAYHQVIGTADLDEALAQLRLSRPDIVIAGGDDAQLIRAIRSEPAGLDIPIISVGHSRGQPLPTGMLRAGADEVFEAPACEKVLLTHIRRLLRRKDRLHQQTEDQEDTSLWGLSEPMQKVFHARPMSRACLIDSDETTDRWQKFFSVCPAIRVTQRPTLNWITHNSEAAPDGVFFIINSMPYADIEHSVRECSSDPRLKHTVKIILAEDMETDRQLAFLDMGADAIFSSTTPPEEIRLRLDRLFSRKHQNDLREKAVLLRCQEASRDPLTDLLNRRAALERLSQMDRGTVYSILIADVDHFKKVNDVYGHAAGDKVLVALSRLFTRTFRKADICTRIGGEEFLIILPDTNSTQAYELAERARFRANSMVVPMGNAPSIDITLSFGVTSSLSGNTETANELIARADKALYLAKANGRNRVVVDHCQS